MLAVGVTKWHNSDHGNVIRSLLGNFWGYFDHSITRTAVVPDNFIIHTTLTSDRNQRAEQSGCNQEQIQAWIHILMVVRQKDWRTLGIQGGSAQQWTLLPDVFCCVENKFMLKDSVVGVFMGSQMQPLAHTAYQVLHGRRSCSTVC
jgi:hypothetical protein